MSLTRRSLLLVGAPVGGAMYGRACADEPAAVRGVHILPFEQIAHITIILDRPVQARTFFLDRPHRFVIDLANAPIASRHMAYGQGPAAGFVRRYRYAPRPDGVVRVLLDLPTPASLISQQLGGLSTPDLSFALAPTGVIVPPHPDRLAHGWTVV